MTVYKRITDAAAKQRAWAPRVAATFPSLYSFLIRACDHADRVVADHYQPSSVSPCRRCRRSTKKRPCREVRKLAEFWLGPGWETS